MLPTATEGSALASLWLLLAAQAPAPPPAAAGLSARHQHLPLSAPEVSKDRASQPCQLLNSCSHRSRTAAPAAASEACVPARRRYPFLPATLARARPPTCARPRVPASPQLVASLADDWETNALELEQGLEAAQVRQRSVRSTGWRPYGALGPPPPPPPRSPPAPPLPIAPPLQMRLLRRLRGCSSSLDLDAEVWPCLRQLFSLSGPPPPATPATPAAALAGQAGQPWAHGMHAYCALIRQQVGPGRGGRAPGPRR